MENIPMSLYIADVKAKLKQIVNHPDLPPAVIEPLLKTAHLEACVRADQQLEDDYIKYNEKNKGKEENKDE